MQLCFFNLDVPANGKVEHTIVLARADNFALAREEAHHSLAKDARAGGCEVCGGYSVLEYSSPLEGDWPIHWKHGWVYDMETLRMMVRRPIGIYKHAWDAMQIQAPRTVLAESSIDMWHELRGSGRREGSSLWVVRQCSLRRCSLLS